MAISLMAWVEDVGRIMAKRKSSNEMEATADVLYLSGFRKQMAKIEPGYFRPVRLSMFLLGRLGQFYFTK